MFRSDFRPLARYLYFRYCGAILQRSWHNEKPTVALKDQVGKQWWGTPGRRNMVLAFEEMGHEYEALLEGAMDPATNIRLSNSTIFKQFSTRKTRAQIYITMIAMLRPICSANTSFRDCGAMPASRFLSMDLFRSWNLKCCNRREIAGTKAETRYFNVTVLGSPLPSHVYHLQRSPLSSALRSYTTNLFTICLTVVSHPVSLVDFPSFTVCYVRVSLSSSMYGYPSSIFLCKKMADTDNHLSSLEYGTQVAPWIRFVGWRGESIDFRWKTSLDRHAIRFCIRTTTTTSASIGSISRGGVQLQEVTRGEAPQRVLSLSLSLHDRST